MFTRAELKQQARAQMDGNIFILFIFTLVTVAVSILCGVVPIIGGLISLLISPALSLGLYKVYLQITYGEKPKFETLFDGFQQLFPSFALVVLVVIFTSLWSLLLLIPGFIKTLSYSMSFYILAENPNMTATEALNESKKIMHGHKMDLFILCLSFIPWFLLVAITFGIAFIWVGPYINLTQINFYHRIKRGDVRTAADDMAQYANYNMQ